MPLAAFVALCGCRDSPRLPADASAAHTERDAETGRTADNPAYPLAVAIDGCDGLFDPPACLTQGTAPLTLWLAGDFSEAAPTLTHAGEALTVDGLEVDADALEVDADALEIDADALEIDADALEIDADAQGVVWTIQPPIEPGELSISTTDGGRFSLQIIPTSPAYRELSLRLDALKREPAQARELLAADTSVRDLRERFLLDCYDVGLAYMTSGTTDELTDAPARLRAAAEGFGDVGCLGRAHARAAYMTIDRAPDFNAAAAHLAAARALPPLYLRGLINVDLFTGELQKRLGGHDESLPYFDRARRLALRTGRVREYVAATVTMAVALAGLGRFDEARALGSQAERAQLAQTSPTAAARLNLNTAWTELLYRENDPSVADPSPRLRAAIEHYATSGDAPGRSRAYLNLAFAAAQTGDPQAIADALAAVEREHLTARDLVWYELVSARLARARAKGRAARQHLERAETFAQAGAELEHLLWIALERAELERVELIEDKDGDSARARVAFANAETIADQLAMGITVDAGRSLFSTSRSRARALHVELLLDLDDRPAALCTILSARARHLRSLSVHGGRDQEDPESAAEYRQLLSRYHERREALSARLADAWKLSKRELASLQNELARERGELDGLLAQAMALVERDPPPWRCEDARPDPRAADHGLLTMFPTSQRDAWWFLIERGGEIEVARASGTPLRASEEALARLAEAGAFRGLSELVIVPTGLLIDVDLHVLEPLSDGGPARIVYGLGLGRSGDSSSTVLTHTAVVMTGSSAGLSEARLESEEVTDALGAGGWEIEPRWRPEHPRPPGLLHYSGHGRYAGLLGWDSALLVGDGDDNGDALTSGRILAYQRAPAAVVLGACDAGTSDPAAIDGGMNMATAFVLAGARLVIAPRGPVDDELAREFAAELYASAPPDPRAGSVRDELVARLSALTRRDPRFALWRAWVP